MNADRATKLRRGVRPRDIAGKTLRARAADLVSEVRHLDRRIAMAARDIEAAVEASATLADPLTRASHRNLEGRV